MRSTLAKLILDVADLDRSLAFYAGVLELPIALEDTWDGHRVARLKAGSTEIMLLQQPLHEQNPALDRRGGIVINLTVKDLVTLARACEHLNLTVLQTLQNATWGERTFVVADPDGYSVLLSEPVETVH